LQYSHILLPIIINWTSVGMIILTCFGILDRL
jgi:hypothetical protein